MVSALISRIVILLFGTLYPAYASYKAVKTKNVKEYVKWMMYWIVFAFFTCIETFADIFIAWVPFYYEMKILFVLWLLSPATKGASILYRKFLHPQLAKREKEIDTYIAKASDQGYSAILSLGSKGFNYATNVVLTTAIKGQAKITDHIRKSYSMSDLTGEPQRRLHADDSEPELDDETDNRLIEESYREEMMEKERRMSATEGDIDDQENRPRRRRAASKEDPGLYRVEETEEEAMAKGSRKSYSHKEAVDAVNVLSKSSPTSSIPTASRKGSLSGPTKRTGPATISLLKNTSEVKSKNLNSPESVSTSVCNPYAKTQKDTKDTKESVSKSPTPPSSPSSWKAYHYGTLPRQKGRTRSSIRKN